MAESSQRPSVKMDLNYVVDDMETSPSPPHGDSPESPPCSCEYPADVHPEHDLSIEEEQYQTILSNLQQHIGNKGCECSDTIDNVNQEAVEDGLVEVEILSMPLQEDWIKDFISRDPDIFPDGSTTDVDLVKKALTELRESLKPPSCDQFWKEMDEAAKLTLDHYPGIVAALRRVSERSHLGIKGGFKNLEMTEFAIRGYFQIELPQFLGTPTEQLLQAVKTVKEELKERDKEKEEKEDAKRKRREDFAMIVRVFNEKRKIGLSHSDAMEKARGVVAGEAEPENSVKVKREESEVHEEVVTKTKDEMLTVHVVPVRSPSPSTISIKSEDIDDLVDSTINATEWNNIGQEGRPKNTTPMKQDPASPFKKHDEGKGKVISGSMAIRTPKKRYEAQQPSPTKSSGSARSGTPRSSAKKQIEQINSVLTSPVSSRRQTRTFSPEELASEVRTPRKDYDPQTPSLLKGSDRKSSAQKALERFDSLVPSWLSRKGEEPDIQDITDCAQKIRISLDDMRQHLGGFKREGKVRDVLHSAQKLLSGLEEFKKGRSDVNGSNIYDALVDSPSPRGKRLPSGEEKRSPFAGLGFAKLAMRGKIPEAPSQHVEHQTSVERTDLEVRIASQENASPGSGSPTKRRVISLGLSNPSPTKKTKGVAKEKK